MSVTPATAAREASISWRTRFFPQVGLPVHSIEDARIPRPAAADGHIAARVIRPVAQADDAPTVVYLHGGAWAVGDLDSHEAHARLIANRTGAVVVNVDYRLAPEHPFPAGHDDAVTALAWATSHSAELGGSADAIGVAGDSAGGNLALAAALASVEQGLPLRAALLLYAVTDFTRISGSRVEHDYFGEHWEQTRTDPRASPALSTALPKLPHTIVGVGAHDWLVEDNQALAQRLQAAGVTTTLRVYPTLPHGFYTSAGVSTAARDAADELAWAFAAALRDQQ